MKSEILNNHLLASKSAVSFLDYAVTQGRCLEKLELLDDTLPEFFRSYPYPLHSWPWFISVDMKRMFQECVRHLPELIYRAIKKEFEDDSDRFCQFFNRPAILSEIFLDSGLDLLQIMFRIDAVLTSSGLKIMEINAGPNIGGWQIQWMDEQYRKQSQLIPFFEANSCISKNIPLGYMRHVIERASTSSASESGQANVLFIIDKTYITDDFQQIFQPVFEKALQECGCDGSISFDENFDNISFRQGGVYFHDKRLTGLINFRSDNELTIPREFYRAFLRGQVYWPGNPFDSIIGDKRSLAILHKYKESGVFSDEERRFIDDYVPWCVTIGEHAIDFEGTLYEPENFLKQRRESLVIKAANGFQGSDVYVGKYQSPDAWRNVVDSSLSAGSWLAQEYCESLPFYGQSGYDGYGIYDVIWGVFGFGLEYGGCWLRLMAKDSGDGIINSSKGAQETIVYEVIE